MYGNGITYITRVSQPDLLISGCRQIYVLTANQDSALENLMWEAGCPNNWRMPRLLFPSTELFFKSAVTFLV